MRKSKETRGQQEADSREKKPGFVRRIGRHLGAVSGLQSTWERVSSIPGAWKGAVKSRRELLRSNLESEQEFRQMKFHEVLRAWGVNNPTQRAILLKSKKREYRVGIFLIVLGSFATALQLFDSNWIIWLGAFAGFSVFLLGLTLVLTSWWRMEVIRRERFLPFLDWLRGGFQKHGA